MTPSNTDPQRDGIVNLTRLADHKTVGAVQYDLRTFGPWV
jgi:hypothetical protein